MKFEWDKAKAELEDDLQDEYDLKSLRVKEFWWINGAARNRCFRNISQCRSCQ
jgi:hypothetical protein